MVKNVLFAITTMVLGFSAFANAATLVVDQGFLLGADDVDVDGTLYDVRFKDGTCVDLFDGCDEPSDFIFSTSSSAGDAAFALKNQVFLGIYDADPSKTNGCIGSSFCDVVIPYAVISGPFISVNLFWNTSNMGTDLVLSGGAISSTDFGNEHDRTYAIFSLADSMPADPVPVPGAALLFAPALAGLFRLQRIQKSA